MFLVIITTVKTCFNPKLNTSEQHPRTLFCWIFVHLKNIFTSCNRNFNGTSTAISQQATIRIPSVNLSKSAAFCGLILSENFIFLCNEKQLTRLIYWSFSKLTNFWPMFSFYTPWKTPGNQSFWGFFRGNKMETFARNRLTIKVNTQDHLKFTVSMVNFKHFIACWVLCVTL